MPEYPFLSESQKVDHIEELKGEGEYYEKVRKIEGKNLVVKNLGTFSTVDEAEKYISRTPSRIQGGLKKYIPETDYVISRDKDDSYAVTAFSPVIEGKRLDSIPRMDLSDEVLAQLDDFISESIKLFELDRRNPGISFRNFILDGDNKLFYIDSEPFSESTYADFELAHARKERLLKEFGQGASDKFPLTFAWIKQHQVEYYRKAKREKNRRKPTLRWVS